MRKHSGDVLISRRTDAGSEVPFPAGNGGFPLAAEAASPLWEAIARVWRFAERVTAYRFPPGIYKHRSIEQAQQLRDKWEEANFRAFWERKNAEKI